MDFLRIILLLSLLAYGSLATDHARCVLREQKKGSGTYSDAVTKEDKVYIRYVAGLASVKPASIVVQDGMLLGTGQDRAADFFDPTAHAEIEAIRDASRRAKTSVLRNGVLYASRKPCTMCMSVIEQAGIRNVYYSTVTDRQDSSIYIIHVRGTDK